MTKPPTVPASAGVENPATGTHVTSAFAIAEADPDRPAIVDSRGRTSTYSNLVSAAHRFANGLQDLGVGRGDAIVILAPNCLEFVELYFAALEIGVYVAPANWHLTGPEVAYILDNSEAKAFFAAERFAGVADAARRESGIASERCFAIGDVAGFRPLGELSAGHNGDELPRERTLGGPMLYTSGTTGKPKGVRRPLTGASPDQVSVPNYFFFAGFGIAEPDNVHLCGSPMYHTAVLNFVVISLQLGQLVVLMDKWSAEEMLRLIDAHRVTHSHMVPTQFARLLELEESVRASYDVSSLRNVIHGAAPCPLHVKRAMLEWWGPVITEYYAGTEGGGCTITGAEWLRKPGSVGRPWSTTTLQILDDDGAPVPTGEIGNVYMQMHGSSFSYHKAPEKTAGSYVGSMFTMGDLGYVDSDGYLFLCDRKNDMIISGGVNIYPAEIESELTALPQVRDAAVFGIPHPDWGEEVKAVVEPANTLDASDPDAVAALEEAILGSLAARVAKFKLPRSIDFVDALPRQDNGKLVKRVLKDPYWS
ncbi:acyl-CoA synthetase [Dietzia timorensis]|uniref:Long-chain-fatty-acid--CoA ligase FadD13 n=1 Tax=Dietzia timorensis TaxID=499555 RepID=A0A173LNJ0_9ACTN|nr:acyl-CoA synthetase [Dietzia timorensis]ANI93855.1 Long-chain-fatty-acid--CoA ligase FadD13 [Dietzia timorensis]